MSKEIKTAIVGCEIVEETVEPIKQMDEHIARPNELEGTTYKVKTPVSDHALYVTINDMVLNPGTEHEERRPFEIFINSKNMEHFQWIVAVTLMASAVFRKGGDVSFVAEELRSVFDPKGGYFKPGTGKYMPSLVAEIGEIIDVHMQKLGLRDAPKIDTAIREMIAAKRSSRLEQAHDSTVGPQGTLCEKCRLMTVWVEEGCRTCWNCGDSKCG